MKSVGSNWHSLTRRSRMNKKAASLGLEPRQRDPESLVLPLHHEANARGPDLKLNFCFAQIRESRRAASIDRHFSPFTRALDLKIALALGRHLSCGLDHFFDRLVIVRRIV